jgi:hypothetical protein
MKKLTNNQVVAKYILGNVPKGNVLACERCNSAAPYKIGEIDVNGKTIASVPSTLHGGSLPSSKLIAA